MSVGEFVCLECNGVFDEDELTRYEERHGFDDGPFEVYWASPCCAGAYEELGEMDYYRKQLERDDRRMEKRERRRRQEVA